MNIVIEDVGTVDCVDIIRRSPHRHMHGGEAILARWLTFSQWSWVGKVDGEVACIWGLSSGCILADEAHLWLLTTDLVEKHKFLFIRYSQRCVEDMLKLFPVIVGDVDINNESAKRWLKLLGAKFSTPIGTAMHFEIRAKQWHS